MEAVEPVLVAVDAENQITLLSALQSSFDRAYDDYAVEYSLGTDKDDDGTRDNVADVKGVEATDITVEAVQEAVDRVNDAMATFAVEAAEAAPSTDLVADAQTAIDSASVSIENAESEGRTDGLSDAKSLLSQAEDSMELHDYIEATSLAGQALTSADEATVPTQTPEEETPGFELLLVLLGITLVLFLKKRK